MGMRVWSAGAAVIALAMTGSLAGMASAQSSGPENLLPPEPAKVEQALPDYTELRAQQQPRPANPQPTTPQQTSPQPAKPSVADTFGDVRMVSGEVVQEMPSLVGEWSLDEARALASFIDAKNQSGVL